MGGALVVTAVLAFGAAGAAATLQRLQGNIASADVTNLLGDRPTAAPPADPNDPNSGSAVNILLIGSDTRSGDNGDVAGVVSGMRSDTTIVLHISADRTRIEAVSIPRDSLVQIPACQRSDGSTSKAQKAQFNWAFSIGGQNGQTSDAAACTWKTVEQTTGVRLDHFVVIDFEGFIQMVEALKGIPICIPSNIDSPKAELTLNAGFQTLNGTQALGFARARTGKGLGDGSDTNRLGRQQQLLAATVRQIRSKNLLTDMPALINFLDAATKSITVDKGLSSIPDMTGLAFHLKDVPTGNITFMTIPFAPAPTDPNRVVWTSAAAGIWANMAADKPLTATEAPIPEPTTTPASPTSPTTPAGTKTTTAPAAPAATPAQTKEPGKEAFTPDDVTAVCG